MKRFTSWSIRTYLFLMVILSVAPALAIILYTGLELKKKAIADVHASCTTLINTVADDMADTVNETRQLLVMLASLPEVRERRREACRTLFAGILSNNPRYSNLHAFLPNGDQFASAITSAEKVNVSDRKYFRDALRTREFSAGEYIVGRTLKKPMINFAYPVYDENGNLIVMLQAAISLTKFDTLFGKANLPKGSILLLDDHKGTILYHSLPSRNSIGTGDNRQLFEETKGAGETDAIFSRNIDGEKYLTSFKTLRLSKSREPFIYMRLQVPEKSALAGLRAILTRNILFLVLASLPAALAAFLFSHYSILRRARRLVVASEQLAAGKENVRVGIPHENGEFGLIAHAFDRMSETLAQREEERLGFVDELETAVTWALDEKAKSEAIIASIGDGISIQDRDFRVIYQNEVHRKMIGNHVGRVCHEAYEENHQICDPCPLQKCFDDGQVHLVEKSLMLGSEPAYFLITASPLRDSSGEIIGGIELVKDITERKTNEIEKEEISRKLADSNHDLQHFAYIASHDLQEPLRTITSFIQLLAKRYSGKLDKDADEFIGFVTDGAQRMQRLINDLLAYSRVESKGKPFAWFDCGDLLERVLANLRQSIEESGAVITLDHLPVICGDEMQMAQLFQNLIGNAIKFRGSAPPLIHVGIADNQGEWEISIRDNGIGIEPKFFDRIFEIFHRLHSREKYAGTGIGLAVCKKIVERHGGRIWVDSEPGEGTTFSFTIRKGEQA